MPTDNNNGEVQYNTISQGDWDSFPDPHVKPASQWEDVLAALQAGEIVQLHYTDKRDKLSKRISIARQAHARGFRTQMRYTDSTMAIRRLPMEDTSKTPVATGGGRSRGRGRKNRQPDSHTDPNTAVSNSQENLLESLED